LPKYEFLKTQAIKTKTLYLILFLGYTGIIKSQNVSDFNNYANKYTDKDIVYLNVKTEVLVDIVKSDLKIEETNYEETFYNNFKAGIYSDKDIESTHFSKLKDIEASTLLPDNNNNKFKEIKVKEFKTKEVLDDDIFYKDLLSTSFIYPSLRQGAITKLKYTLDIKEPHFFPYQIVKRYAPIENYEFIINSDKDIELGIKYVNTDSANFKFTKEEKGSRIIYTWKANNITSYKTETRSPEYLCYLPQIVPYIKSYKIKDKEINVSRNVDDLFEWYKGFIAKIDHKHTDEMISTVNTLVKDCKSDSEKIVVVYKWVQDNIKYVANEYGLGGFIPRDPYQIFEKRYGDCKDMATIIIELLDIANIKACYTWIGTRDLPYTYEDIPTTIVDNHMIATYIKNGNYYFLDATNPSNPVGLPSSFIQGKEALIKISDDKFEIKTVPVVPAEINIHSDSVRIMFDQGKITGKGNLSLRGYYFSNMKQTIESIKDNNDKLKLMKSFLEKGNNKFVLDNYKFNTASNTMRIDYTFNIADYVKMNSDEMYLNMNLAQPYDDFELFKDDRKLDYEFYFKSLVQHTFSFAIPEKYEVSYLPKNSQFNNKYFSYNLRYEVKGNNIIYHFSMITDILLLKPELFPEWNKMLKQLRSDYKEAIVLKKKP